MNTYIKNGLLVGLSTLLLTACNDRLTVQPTQSIDASQALNTERDVQITLTGAYDGISDVNLYGGGIQYTGELLGDNRDVVFGGTFTTLDELWRKTVTTTNVDVRDLWLDSYNAINRANNVLANLDKVSAANRNNYEGQARFLRGSLYFELVKFYGKSFNDGTPASNLGVPLVLTPTATIGDADSRPRNSVAEVYAQVLDDLTKAEQLLPASQPASFAGTADPKGFANKVAAQAMLARVYLQQQNFAGARDAANRAITAGTFSLASTFAGAFTDTSPETIFKVLVTDQDGSNALNTYYGSTRVSGRGDIRVQTKFRQLYEAADVRGQFFTTVNNNVFTNKFNDRFGDVPVIRLAEMYLVRAETNLRLNTTVGATPLADVNLIRARAAAPALTSVNLAAVLLERRLELAFEGQQIADIKRTAGTVGTTPYNANNLVLPIPQREIDTNKQLTQNPGY
ncbi:RagB/SusD family nutrient uptake outer membrane protein [Spirosoma sordidisoli]|uniref:RagB/SusD family nutrient uptake outer membrane protein n=1 Tax=Spirosoma sordidisoli TaxID=2502893 RepID=A0A4Q2UQL8_9BACT|nr:RagB/SusD family nutrient uptake outer membrane protein [Spirosoma sordidisoli]RYC72057.1 RagB/SusD family nutrient uptake outer membrane protein [Spirosoma sordidisoli]